MSLFAQVIAGLAATLSPVLKTARCMSFLVGQSGICTLSDVDVHTSSDDVPIPSESWLSPKLELRSSPIHGQGTYARAPIAVVRSPRSGAAAGRAG